MSTWLRNTERNNTLAGEPEAETRDEEEDEAEADRLGTTAGAVPGRTGGVEWGVADELLELTLELELPWGSFSLSTFSGPVSSSPPPPESARDATGGEGALSAPGALPAAVLSVAPAAQRCEGDECSWLACPAAREINGGPASCSAWAVAGRDADAAADGGTAWCCTAAALSLS